jgi:histidinol-phosphate aminotransferase
MYEIYAQGTGATVVRVQANPERAFRFPVEIALSSITERTRMVAIASPNNPTGTVVSHSDLLRIVDAAPQAAVLVDEAYYDFWGETVLDAVERFPNLFVTRTFSKAYGLAALRIGVLAGNSLQMPMVRKVASPYNVNGIALACLPHAIADREFLANYVQQVLQGRARLMIQLACQGVPYWVSQANFVLANIGLMHKEFVAEMRKRGILVRDRSSDPGCNGCVRMTVGTVEHTERLLVALPEVLKAIGWAPIERVAANPAMGSVR